MDSGLLVLLEFLLIIGLVLWFGFSQLRSLNRQDKSRSDDKNP